MKQISNLEEASAVGASITNVDAEGFVVDMFEWERDLRNDGLNRAADLLGDFLYEFFNYCEFL